MAGLSVSVESSADESSSRTVIRLAGEADATTTGLRQVLAAEAAKRPRLLLVDMSELTFIDSAALSEVLRLYRELRRTECSLALISPSTAVERVLQLVGADRVIPIYASADEAASLIHPG